jgi:hypothetical protein
MYSFMSTVSSLIVLSQHSSIYGFIVTAAFFPTILSPIKGIENSTVWDNFLCHYQIKANYLSWKSCVTIGG